VGVARRDELLICAVHYKSKVKEGGRAVGWQMDKGWWGGWGGVGGEGALGERVKFRINYARDARLKKNLNK
jgi:hypothetical protein